MAVEFIREAIASRVLRPGAKIEQDEIAGELGSSRLPIREALIELTAKGFVVAIPRRGAYVVQLSVEDIEDHFEVVGLLFAVAARRAADRLSDAELAELRRLNAEIAATRDDSECQDLNHRFLRTINEAGSSNRLLLTLRYLWLSLPNDFYTSAPDWAANESMYREQILDLLEARDGEAAASSAEAHLQACAKVTVDSLRAQEYWSGPTTLG
ncbi:GntR family transcriptional regulator [Mycobacterium sp. CVI_P3]|uniref:GntR family transcriptional regulator n=1 Tax=Mycobacterium pinniadriaticum TaxID=2994102 RepID=A0ABT3SKY1_9MYCO|nr:GntR family transcriptional regulator [Mycobacterium pinniadriaticum]MCX2933754.1 GntR family transcriptional regulator [Mycobacterium pinniadriaticum]MCX2940176.1 GntR family transcriptional regulator [Mycobacterium pinniadriaticum]